jgi:hypothetical protein
VDFRKQHDGLVAIVRGELGSDPLDGSLFAFFNRRRDRIKLLLWDANGFWLFYKRLERGTFERLRSVGSARLQITRGELSMLLVGADVNPQDSAGDRHLAEAPPEAAPPARASGAAGGGAVQRRGTAGTGNSCQTPSGCSGIHGRKSASWSSRSRWRLRSISLRGALSASAIVSRR